MPDGVRYCVSIDRDIKRVVRQDDYDVAEAIQQAFRMVKEDGVTVHMPSDGRLQVIVERVR